MKKFICIAGALALLVLVIIVATQNSGSKYSSDLDGETRRIGWELVNLREEPSTRAEIFAELENGDTVTLTGWGYHVLGGNDVPEEDWVQVRTQEGQTGWIVRSSLAWQH